MSPLIPILRDNSHVKPGGWVEQVDISLVTKSDDDSIPHDGAIAKWTSLYDQVGEKLGTTFRAAEASRPAIEAAGFQNITDRTVKVPVGPWAKNKRLKTWGEWFQFFVLEGLEGFGLRSFTNVLGLRRFLTCKCLCQRAC